MDRAADEEIIPLRELEARLWSARAREAVAAEGPSAAAGWQHDVADIGRRFADLRGAGIDDGGRDAPVAMPAAQLAELLLVQADATSLRA